MKDGIVVGRGWTQAAGRPHAEAVALAQAGDAAREATLYVTLEPCAHQSARGPACAELVAQSGLRRAVVGVRDPDPRTAGDGISCLREAGIEVDLAKDPACRESLAGYLLAKGEGRPHVTLKLACSIDGCIALPNGESRWITGDAARAHVHRQRARCDAICVGGGTLRADDPSLDVRLPGLKDRSPARFVLTGGEVPGGWSALRSPQSIKELADIQYLYLEGGAAAAAAFLAADLVDTIHVYRAPILIGGGRPAIADLGLDSLAEAHDRWRRSDTRRFGNDTLDIFHRNRQEG